MCELKPYFAPSCLDFCAWLSKQAVMCIEGLNWIMISEAKKQQNQYFQMMGTLNSLKLSVMMSSWLLIFGGGDRKGLCLLSKHIYFLVGPDKPVLVAIKKDPFHLFIP